MNIPVKQSIVILAFLGLAGWGSSAPVHDFGCFASAGTDLHGRPYSRGLGPLIEVTGPGDRPALAAFRPFYAVERDADTGLENMDILWPLAHVRHWHDEADWRVLSAVYVGPKATEPPSTYRFWILPVLAMGRNSNGEDYGAVFPLGGRIDHWFGRDRVEFALFPLYWHSELNDLRTDHWLWPIISRTTGRDLNRFRVFPFYGRSEKKGEGGSRYILWPFWTSSHIDRPGISGSGFMAFPFYGHAKTEVEETWMFLPPFFRHTVGRQGIHNVYLWPFIQMSSSKKEDKLYVWPLYGRRTRPEENRQFWLWPFIWKRHEIAPPITMDCFQVFPLFYSESHRPVKTPDVVTDRHVSVWPLLSYQRTGEETKRVRVVDLWPFRDTAPIERNLSPLWTVYRYERTPRGRENELLWGVARWGSLTNGTVSGSVFPLASWAHDRTADSYREWDFLKGMIGYQRNETGKTWRVLYVLRWRTTP